MARVVVDFNMTGLESVKAAFVALPDNLRRKVIRPALRSGAAILLAETRRRAPVDTGKLRGGLRIKAKRRSRVTMGYYVPTPRRDVLGIPQDSKWYYPAIIEYGAPKRKRGGPLAAREYMRGALRDTATAVRDKVIESMGILLEQVAKTGKVGKLRSKKA